MSLHHVSHHAVLDLGEDDVGETFDSAKRFERPVVIRVEGRDRIVVDINDAADILLRSFPRETERRKAAMAACLAVIRGKAHPLRARRELVSAALEVGILAGIDLAVRLLS